MNIAIKAFRNWRAKMRGLAVYKVRLGDDSRTVYIEAGSPQEARRWAAFIYKGAPLTVTKAE